MGGRHATIQPMKEAGLSTVTFGKRKFEVLTFVVEYCANSRYGPTVEEIREAVGLTTRSSVQWHLNDLQEDGLLTRIPRKHRSLKPTGKGQLLQKLLVIAGNLDDDPDS